MATIKTTAATAEVSNDDAHRDDGQGKENRDERVCFECKRSLARSPQVINVAGNSSHWHPECFKCFMCHEPLDKSESCRIYKDKIVCHSDYARLQRNCSIAKCARCRWPISALDWVRRASVHVYHLACFNCDICLRQLNTGEQFTISVQEERGVVTLLCRLHFAIESESNQKSTPIGDGGGGADGVSEQPPALPPSGSCGEQFDLNREHPAATAGQTGQPPCADLAVAHHQGHDYAPARRYCGQNGGATTTTRGAIQDGLPRLPPSGQRTSGDEGKGSALGSQQYFHLLTSSPSIANGAIPKSQAHDVVVSVHNGGGAHQQQQQQQQHHHQQLVCDDAAGAVHGSHASSSANSSSSPSVSMLTPTGSGNSSKSKRVRTTFTEDQLSILQTHFHIDSNPDGQDLERIATITGLSKRVTQVWFQNSRARQKKYMIKRKPPPTGGGGVGNVSSSAATSVSSISVAIAAAAASSAASLNTQRPQAATAAGPSSRGHSRHSNSVYEHPLDGRHQQFPVAGLNLTLPADSEKNSPAQAPCERHKWSNMSDHSELNTTSLDNELCPAGLLEEDCYGDDDDDGEDDDLEEEEESEEEEEEDVELADDRSNSASGGEQLMGPQTNGPGLNGQDGDCSRSLDQ